MKRFYQCDKTPFNWENREQLEICPICLCKTFRTYYTEDRCKICNWKIRYTRLYNPEPHYEPYFICFHKSNIYYNVHNGSERNENGSTLAAEAFIKSIDLNVQWIKDKTFSRKDTLSDILNKLRKVQLTMHFQ